MPAEKPYNLDPNIEAAFCYIPGIGLAILFLEKSDEFIRFHAFQSVFYWIVAFAAYSMADTLKTFVIGFFITPLVSIGITLMWLYLMWQAYSKKQYKLPIIGDIAQEQAQK